jgi:hypothetical protein
VMPFGGRWWDAEHGFASVVLCVQCDVARRGGWFPAAAPPSVRETLSWLERSPSMLQLQWGERDPHAAPPGGRVAKASSPLDAVRTPRWSPRLWPAVW